VTRVDQVGRSPRPLRVGRQVRSARLRGCRARRRPQQQRDRRAGEGLVEGGSAGHAPASDAAAELTPWSSEDLVSTTSSYRRVTADQEVDDRLHVRAGDLLVGVELRGDGICLGSHRGRAGEAPVVVVEVDVAAGHDEPVHEEERERVDGPRVGTVEEHVVEAGLGALLEHPQEAPVVGVHGLGGVRVADHVAVAAVVEPPEHVRHPMVEVEEVELALPGEVLREELRGVTPVDPDLGDVASRR
jgi:hypothetical protein